MKKLLILLIPLLLLSACSQSIEDIKIEEFIGKQVNIQGTVENTIKIGELSGYTLIDDENNKIPVSTKDLPKEGEKIRVKGTLMKDTLFGYYVLVN